MIEVCPNCGIREGLPEGVSESVAADLNGVMARGCLQMCVLNEDPGIVGINCRDGGLETTVEVAPGGERTGATVVYVKGRVSKKLMPNGEVQIL